MLDVVVVPDSRSALLLPLTEESLEEAGLFDPPGLRTLDAIHLEAARSLGSDLAVLITYDERPDTAASALGTPVDSPGDEV